jgi:Ran GTPase-activating protein (RanGAP) involved in mRNA processing and transport
VDLGWNNFGDVGTEILAVVLPQCLALSHLELWVNDIGQVGVGRLADVLPHCPALFRLSLGGNPLRDQGGKRLAGVLPQCKTLCELHLLGCDFGDTGGQPGDGDELAGIFAEVLPQCPVLSLFDLSQNHFSEDAERMIQASWCGPHQLRMLADYSGFPGLSL